ncbi:5'-3' exoribonuclease [Thecamonas trahens ATCC 50062]|uniref:5'-3' exoribonuclease n=1 Tax=Thecamonas trahens ATCC 50062 TaxID=461836 RepID=A0A0L0DB01_THETB|nr:5'-3' exoribonuclease [Thecamonas trahens ATCC 50062]KNC49529.1 5'-3' exoribonuclease [Thecamonas trahens ATCC 50062]|eukprot:XP_013757644.1 5'-3' exoribonuclease [Thecamonas trahens ATCC 50062]
MGIPKLFRFISERYPEINRKANTLPPPVFHNLYMDLNGVLHNATHSNDEAVSYKKDPVTIAAAVFGYIERVFSVVGPQRLLFIAVDGVAPRAKVNQQRQRRFKAAAATEAGLKAAKEAKAAARAARKAVAAEPGAGPDAAASLSESDDESDDESGEDDDDDAAAANVFDSNCITPGTQFMAALVDQLKYFVAHKVATDAEWQAISVIVSGPDVPGEGEHKIMDFIRAAKSAPGYDPNTSHCLHGLDADLIMLGLATHEPLFTLVREKVVFGQSRVLNERSAIAVQQTDDFEMLHLAILREYLINEFKPRAPLAFAWDIERLLDDFVFMCFFIGNDFLPPLPLMDIDKGGLKVVFDTYKKLLPTWSDWLVDAGACVINPLALQALFDALREREARVMRARHPGELVDPPVAPPAAAADADAAATDALKQMLNVGASPSPAPPAPSAWAPPPGSVSTDQQAAGQSPVESAELDPAANTPTPPPPAETDNNDDDDDAAAADDAADAAPDYLLSMAHLLGVQPETLLEPGKRTRRKRKAPEPTEPQLAAVSANSLTPAQKAAWWYDEKFPHMAPAAPEDYVHDVVSQYIQGLAWNLSYYYQGVLSWSWFYGYYCAPLLADLGSIRDAVVAYDTTATPFSPFEQLMAVLPHYSASLLPPPLAELMTAPDSPLAPYFPADYGFIPDESGRSWKDIALIPFVDQTALSTEVAARLAQCSPSELARNTPGTAFLIHYNPSNKTQLSPPGELAVLPALTNAPVAIVPYTTPRLAAPFTPKLCAGARPPPAAPVPGFPSFATVRYLYTVRSVGVQTVAGPSREDSLIILPDESALASIPSARYLAEKYLGQTVYANWPYLVEARVVALSTPSMYYYPGTGADDGIVLEDVVHDWDETVARLDNDYLIHHGIKLRDIRYVFHVTVLHRLVLHADGSVTKDFGPDPKTGLELLLPLQLAVRTVPAPDTRYVPKPVPLTQLYARGAAVAVVGGVHFGGVGTVLEVASSSKGKGEADDNDGPSASGPASYKLNVAVTPPLDLDIDLTPVVKASRSERYVSTNDAAREVGMSQLAVARITGAVTVSVPGPATIHIGLGVKFSGRGLRIVGYARRRTIRSAGGTARQIWEFSTKTLGLLKTLKARFPTFVNALSRAPNERSYKVSALFGSQKPMMHLRRLIKWLSELEVASLPLVPDDMASLSASAIAALEDELDAAAQAAAKPSKPKLVKAVPATHLVNVHTISRVTTPAALPTKFYIGDRVRSVRPAGPIPFGTCGYIVTLRGTTAELVLDRPIITGSTLSGRLATLRGVTVSTSWLVNLSRPPASATPPEDRAAAKAAKAAKAAAAEAAKPKVGKDAAISNNPFAALL